MMHDEQRPAPSPREKRLAEKFVDKTYRDAYVAQHTRQFLARQVRALRGDMTQDQFGKVLEKPQSVISRLEDPNYGKWALQTAFDVAAKCDVAVVIRFVDHGTFLRLTSDMSDAAVHPSAFSQEIVDKAAEKERQKLADGALKAFFVDTKMIVHGGEFHNRSPESQKASAVQLHKETGQSATGSALRVAG